MLVFVCLRATLPSELETMGEEQNVHGLENANEVSVTTVC